MHVFFWEFFGHKNLDSELYVKIGCSPMSNLVATQEGCCQVQNLITNSIGKWTGQTSLECVAFVTCGIFTVSTGMVSGFCPTSSRLYRDAFRVNLSP